MKLADSSVWDDDGPALARVGTVERQLIDLRYEIRMSELRVREAISERDRWWRNTVVMGIPILANLLAKIAPAPTAAPAAQEPMHETDQTAPDPAKEPREQLPVPQLEPGPITMEQYHALPLEKFEFWDGYLFWPADYPEPRRHLLALLLVNEGLLEAVKLAPAELWRQALQRVYGLRNRQGG